MTTTGSSIPSPLVAESPQALIRITGPDARRFCNGMFTNTVRDLPVGGVNRHAFTDDRGRVLGFLDLLCQGDEQFLAVVDAGVRAADFMERYERFVVFDDVELDDVGEELVLRAVIGESPVDVLHAAEAPVPSEGRWASAEGVVAAWWSWGWPGAGARLLLPRQEARQWDVRLGTQDAPGELERLRVLAGVARYPDDTFDKTLPHELGVRDVMLHFDKGCYLGQETINRVDVMGQVRRRLVGVHVAAAAAELAGAEVHADKRMGPLTSLVALPDGSTLGLALVREAAWTGGTAVQLVREDRRWEATVIALPVEPGSPVLTPGA
ncbi:MAG: hypothetical protein KTR31_39540 [Myxococcales bacterium]|nr:hypothetical protein [Myxococcales bacterium]